MKDNLLKFWKLYILIILVIGIGTTLILINKEESKGNSLPISNLIISLQNDLNMAISTDNVERYSEVGTLDNELVYAFSDMSYSDLVKRFNKKIEIDALKNELIFRKFKTSQNNLLFSKNDEFETRKKLFNTNNMSVTEIDINKMLSEDTTLIETLETFTEKGFYDYKTYKLKSVNKKDSFSEMDVVYVVGKNDEGEKILKSYFYINGEKQTLKERFYYPNDYISGFAPIYFDENDKSNIIDEQSAKYIIERTENYQGSIPYVDQNFEENNKVMKKGE